MFPDGPGSAVCMQPPDTSAFQAKIDDLEANWTPTGIYSEADLDSIVSKVMAMVNSEHNAVMTFRAAYDSSFLAEAEDEFNAIGKQAVDYLAARDAARAAGTPISAPGFKAWVVAAMKTVQNGMNALAIASCMKPWFLGALALYQGYFDVAWDAAKAVTGLVIDAAVKVVKAVEAGIGLTAWLIRWAPLVLFTIIGVGGWLWHKRRGGTFPSLLPGG